MSNEMKQGINTEKLVVDPQLGYMKPDCMFLMTALQDDLLFQL